MSALDRATADALFHYDPITGFLTWRVRPSQGVKIGHRAGRLNTFGHRQVTYKGRAYLAHRIAWLMCYGHWPEQPIDHVNLQRDDNSIANLRLVTTKQNNENKALYTSNSSGYRGVSFDKREGRWVAYIGHYGKTTTLGHFDAPDEAGKVAAAARAKLFTHSTEYTGPSPERTCKRTGPKVCVPE